MYRKPTDCKHHHNNDEHSDDFFLRDFLSSLVFTYVMIRRHLVEPQLCSNYDVEDADDGERQEVGDNKDVTPEGQGRYNSVIKAAGTTYEFEDHKRE